MTPRYIQNTNKTRCYLRVCFNTHDQPLIKKYVLVGLTWFHIYNLYRADGANIDSKMFCNIRYAEDTRVNA